MECVGKAKELVSTIQGCNDTKSLISCFYS